MCVMCILLQWKNNKTQIHLIKKKVYLNELGIIMSPSLQRPVKSLLEAYTVNRGRFELKFSLTRQPQRSPPLRVPAHSCWAENVSIFVHPFVQSDVSLRAYFVPSAVLGAGGPRRKDARPARGSAAPPELTLNSARTSWSSFSSAQSRLLAASCKGPFTHLLERLFTLKERVRS